MTIQTRDFGAMEIDEQQTLKFVVPVFGFDDLERYVLLSDDETSGLMWLQSVEDPEVCFILLDPEEIGLPYAPEISGEMAQLLELEGQQPALRLISVVPEDFRDTTVNTKSPIVINQGKRLAAQVLLDANYPIRLRLFDKKEAEEEC